MLQYNLKFKTTTVQNFEISMVTQLQLWQDFIFYKTYISHFILCLYCAENLVTYVTSSLLYGHKDMEANVLIND